MDNYNKTKILIVGLGGVGGYFGGLLAKHYKNHPNIDIVFIARGENLEEIRKNGLTILKESEKIIAQPDVATDNIKDVGKVDYVILATKSYDLATTIEQLKPCISSGTVILPLLNGIDISEHLRTLLPENEIWEGCVYIVSRLIKPGVIESTGPLSDLHFGAKNGSKMKLFDMEKIMKDAHINTFLEDNIKKTIWKKFIFISVTASLTSYFDVGFRALLTDSERKRITMKCLEEIVAVAHSEGVTFEKDIVKNTIHRMESLPEETTTSMHSDFKDGRNAEIETLTHAVIKLGAQNGIETPTYQHIYHQLKAKLNIQTNGIK